MINAMIDWIFRIFSLVQSVSVRCHAAKFEGNSTLDIFVNVVNNSLNRDIEITHVWFKFNGELPVINDKRKLPVRLRPAESWETWIGIERFGESFSEAIYSLARVRLSNGKILKSRENKSVPFHGSVPGDQSSST